MNHTTAEQRKAVDVAHGQAFHALKVATSRALDHGQRVPCIGRWQLWTSTDPEQRARAVAGCAGCPVLTECAACGMFEPTGVWAGIDRTPNRGRPKKNHNKGETK